MPCGHEYHRKRCGFLEGKMVRNTTYVAAARERLRREAKHSQAKHSVARLHMPNPCTNRRDDPADLVSEHASMRCFTRIKRERLQHVTEIHARGPHVDDYFVRTAHPLYEGSEVQGLEVATFTRFEGQRHRRI